jgi:hypothetical protein
VRQSGQAKHIAETERDLVEWVLQVITGQQVLGAIFLLGVGEEGQ